MAYESFDNINQHELQAVIEAEINLFENTRSTNTYTNMEAPTFQERNKLIRSSCKCATINVN